MVSKRAACRCGPVPALSAWLTCLILAGCDGSFGTGGTGELVVPRETLQRIDNTEMSAIAATRPDTRPTTQPAAQIQLTIEEVRQAAIANNLDLKVELLNPTIAQQAITEAQAAFESVFNTNVNYAKIDAPTSSKLNSTQDSSLTTNTGVQVPLRTGGTLDFNVPVNRFETNNQFSTLNPAYTSDFTAAISQPLFKGAGTDANAHAIRIAFYTSQRTEARTKLEVTRVLAEADRLYWRLYASRRALEVRKKEHDLAVSQLERAQRRVRAQLAAEVEVVRAESGVADSLEGVIRAELAVRDRQRELKRVLNRPDLAMNTPSIIVPATEPNAVYYQVDPNRLVDLALKQRMEMLATELQIALETANVKYAKNQMLPLVVLQYQYNINGLGPTLGNSFTMLRDNDFDDHQLGLSLQVPIGNEAARSRLRRSLASRLQAIATKEQQAATIEQEVLGAADQLESSWQRIMAAKTRVAAATRTLQAEIQQFNQGMRTSNDVLDAQTRLANAALSEIQATAEYQIAQVDIAFATGTVLGKAKIVWQATKGPRI